MMQFSIIFFFSDDAPSLNLNYHFVGFTEAEMYVDFGKETDHQHLRIYNYI
jgi:hypothetical protein